MTLLTDWNLTLSPDDILYGQGIDPQVVRLRKPLLMLAAERAHAQGLSLLHPLALIEEAHVRDHRHERIHLVGGTTLTGPQVASHLGGAQRVVAAVCTIGPELEHTVSSLFGEDPRYAMALDGLGNAVVEILAQQVCRRIADQVSAEKLTASTPLSPGSPEWPVEIGQPQIFSLLEFIPGWDCPHLQRDDASQKIRILRCRGWT